MKKYWIAFITVIVLSFAVLSWVGVQIYQQAPPIPEKIVTTEGDLVFTKEDFQQGQNIWQAMGGMEIGSVWGHGSYVAPDWTADWLHKEIVFVLDKWAVEEYKSKFDNLSEKNKSILQTRAKAIFRTNSYDKSSGIITIDPVRAEAITELTKYYSRLFTEGSEEYAIQKNAQPDPVKLKKLSAFFFWSSWAASTNRIDDDATYTNNWPHEKLISNEPTAPMIVWTGVSIILLLLGIGGMASFYASKREDVHQTNFPLSDPLLNSVATPSQKAVIKYFLIVSGLMLLQIILGVITAHYGVEGNAFYGIPISEILPYSITRTWHTQLGIFWIATAWLATGLYILQ